MMETTTYTYDELKNALNDAVFQITLNDGEIYDDDKLTDYFGDDLDLIEATMIIESELDAILPEDFPGMQIDANTTIKDFIELMQDNIKHI